MSTLGDWLCERFVPSLALKDVSEFVGVDLGEIDVFDELSESDIEIVMVSCILERKLYRDIGLEQREKNFLVMAKAFMDHFERTLRFDYPRTLRDLWALR